MHVMMAGKLVCVRQGNRCTCDGMEDRRVRMCEEECVCVGVRVRVKENAWECVCVRQVTNTEPSPNPLH